MTRVLGESSQRWHVFGGVPKHIIAKEDKDGNTL